MTDLGEMYRLADTGAVVSLLSRLGRVKRIAIIEISCHYGWILVAIVINYSLIFAAIEKTLSNKLEDARSAVQLRIVKALKEYRNLYAVQHRLANRMIYPESLKFLPLYGLALCKSTPLRGGHADVLLDERCAAGYTTMALPIKGLLKYLYPSLIRLDEHLLKVCLVMLKICQYNF